MWASSNAAALRKRDVAPAEAAMAEHFRNLDARVAQLRTT